MQRILILNTATDDFINGNRTLLSITNSNDSRSTWFVEVVANNCTASNFVLTLKVSVIVISFVLKIATSLKLMPFWISGSNVGNSE